LVKKKKPQPFQPQTPMQTTRLRRPRPWLVLVHTSDFAPLTDPSVFFLDTCKVGTPFYISPEIVAGQPYSFKSDVWALGCVLFELLALRLPFEHTTLPGLTKLISIGVPGVPIPRMYSTPLRLLALKLLSTSLTDRPTIDMLATNPLFAISRLRHAENEPQKKAVIQPPPPPPPPTLSFDALEQKRCELESLFGTAVLCQAKTAFQHSRNTMLSAELGRLIAAEQVPVLAEFFAQEEQTFGIQAL
jgi:serine/threonine protein kinase